MSAMIVIPHHQPETEHARDDRHPPSPDDPALWRRMLAAVTALESFLAPTLDHYHKQTGLGGWTWFNLLAVLTFEPEPATVVRFHVRDPYSSPQRYLTHLAAAVDKGLLLQSDDEYHLTSAGRASSRQFVDDLRTMMVAVDPLPPAQGERLANLLDRLVEASLNNFAPPVPWGIRLSYKLMPASVPPLPFSEQAISCLAAYRDDSHLAAWQPSGLSGPALESLTLLWRQQATSLAGLERQLVRRAHPLAVYVSALQELREWGYIAGPDETPIVTPTGRDFRQGVEETTDRYFFAPWACLNPIEKNEMTNLLDRLTDGLQANTRGS